MNIFPAQRTKRLKSLLSGAVLSLLIFFSSAAFAQTELRVYRFDIKEEIAAPIWRKTKLAVEEAHEKNVDLIFIQMNTYGGAVDAADSIRTKLLRSRIPVYVLIENNAASAGALIALACDKIYMQPGSTIGAATVVNQEGEQVPDKYQSYMRKKMRSTAEETGRNPDIAEAMVDPDKEVLGISEKGKVVTLTVNEALEYGFCDGTFDNMEEVLKANNEVASVIFEQELAWTDSVINWLIHPAISGLLILVIFGGLYFEMQTPGVGFPLIAAILAALLYFAPLYLEGLAENWEILIFLAGVALLAVEVFVIPGFGVAGVSGMVLIVTSLTLSMVGNVGFDFRPVEASNLLQSFLISIIASTLSIVTSLFLAAKLFETGALARFVLSATQRKDEGYVGVELKISDIIGKTGVAHTSLRPSGRVEIDGQLYDATAETGFIEQGTAVKAVSYTTAQLKVRRA